MSEKFKTLGQIAYEGYREHRPLGVITPFSDVTPLRRQSWEKAALAVLEEAQSRGLVADNVG